MDISWKFGNLKQWHESCSWMVIRPWWERAHPTLWLAGMFWDAQWRVLCSCSFEKRSEWNQDVIQLGVWPHPQAVFISLLYAFQHILSWLPSLPSLSPKAWWVLRAFVIVTPWIVQTRMRETFRQSLPKRIKCVSLRCIHTKMCTGFWKWKGRVKMWLLFWF